MNLQTGSRYRVPFSKILGQDERTQRFLLFCGRHIYVQSSQGRTQRWIGKLNRIAAVG